jgi:hypothetical protein
MRSSGPFRFTDTAEDFATPEPIVTIVTPGKTASRKRDPQAVPPAGSFDLYRMVRL